MTDVSIPIGFSSSLQQKLPKVMKYVNGRFQSLSGFQVRCNGHRPGRPQGLPRRFNPYRVFKFVATLIGDISKEFFRKVSIPIGFSSSLQHLLCNLAESQGYVSIPIGFSSSLQHITLLDWGTLPGRFQSLSGFQVRCNVGPTSGMLSPHGSFNPYRVFKFVATRRWLVFHCEHRQFQSLSGFQVRCNAL